jgi:hypothetical protein
LRFTKIFGGGKPPPVRRKMKIKEWLDLLEILNELEIKGSKNIFLMYKIMAFINGKINELQKAETECKPEGG